MELANYITAITLIRQDDVPSKRTKQKCDAKHFLAKYLAELKGQLNKSSQFDFQGSFFLLGRSSVALLLTCKTLSRIPDLIRLITDIQKKIRNKEKLDLGMFEPYCFPSIEIKSRSLCDAPKMKNNIIPALIFVRTPENLNTLIPKISADVQIMMHVYGIYLGFGVYNLIFYLKFETLYELRDKINLLRKCIGTFWETTTIIGVPSTKLRKREVPLAEYTDEVPFSTSAKCMGGLDIEVANGILRLSKRKRFRHLFAKLVNKSKVVNYRQGYMDIEAHFWSKTISDAFDFSCAIRRLDGVIDTCSVVQLPIGMPGTK